MGSPRPPWIRVSSCSVRSWSPVGPPKKEVCLLSFPEEAVLWGWTEVDPGSRGSQGRVLRPQSNQKVPCRGWGDGGLDDNVRSHHQEHQRQWASAGLGSWHLSGSPAPEVRLDSQEERDVVPGPVCSFSQHLVSLKSSLHLLHFLPGVAEQK